MNAITVVPQSFSYSELEKMAASIAQSGLFGIKTKDQAIAIMEIVSKLLSSKNIAELYAAAA